jgi:hypothetical protein
MKRKIYQIPFFSGLFVLAVVGSCRSESETPNVQETADMRISPADFARPADSISQPVGTIAPNPARQLTTVTFHTGNKDRRASMLLVHDSMGNVKFRKNLDAAEGRVSIDTTPWLQGVYIVSVITDGKALQSKLLKE